MTSGDNESTRSGYDRLAGAYAQRFLDELDGKPFDRRLLDHFAADVSDRGDVCDVGCGPGHVARYLRDRGINVFGLDLSPAMVATAREHHPEIRFVEGDMAASKLPDASLAGVVAFYAIVNSAPEKLAGIFEEFARVLKPGGLLLLAFHIGDERRHVDELLDVPVSLDFFFHDTHAVVEELRAAGFTIEIAVERAPYAPDVEHQSRRAYIFARRA